MESSRPFWRGLLDKFAPPKIDDEDFERRLEEVRQSLPVPVFWLLGKAQSGKTSLVRAVTGGSRTEIGNGFRPCTRSAELYSFPNDRQCFLRFLDTRGLGEVDYDPSEDIRRLEKQAHLLIVVMRAMDHAQQCVLDPLRAILKRHPKWPVIVLQTALHEGYGASQNRHVLPYPYGEFPYPNSVPTDVARSLASQRKWFADYQVRFVPVDFTLPEDGYDPEQYGLESLWTAIEEALPMGLWAMFKDSPEAKRTFRDERFRAARPHVLFYALAAGGAGAVPLPMVDIPVVLAIQAKLFHTVASIFDQPMNAQRMTEISSALGIGLLGRQSVRELLKLIPVPGLGSGIAGLYAAASTFALGGALCEYFSRVLDGDVPDQNTLRKLYAQEFEKGRLWLEDYLKQRVGPKEPSR